MNEQDVREMVRKRYGEIAAEDTSCCGPSSCGCGSSNTVLFSEGNGYSRAELETLPEGADLGLGCGNPLAHAAIKEGDTVLDLGSGAGIDCFLAAQAVGESGKVIGVDMTPEMLYKARENAEKGGYRNVEFRLGEIENLPIADNLVDLVISNCVINLSPDKQRVFQEVFRVLKPGGRLMISDIVLLKPLDDSIKISVEAYVGCVAGASLKQDYIGYIESAGLQNVEVLQEDRLSTGWINSGIFSKDSVAPADISDEQIRDVASSIVSVKVSAIKP